MSDLNEITKLLKEARDRIVRLTNSIDPECEECGGDATGDGQGHRPKCIVARLAAAAVWTASPDRRTDDDIRALWRAAGGDFHGPIVEHGTIKEADLLPFLRRLTAGQVSPPAGLPPPTQPRTGDAIPGAPSRAAMRSVEDGLRRQLAQRRVRRAAP